MFHHQYASMLRLLKAYESPLPIDLFLATHAPSIAAILCSECRSPGIFVANVGDSSSEDVAKAAVGILVDVIRKINAADRFTRRELWPACGDYPQGSKLQGKRVGIVGLGRIGSKVAERQRLFGCKISYNSRKEKPSLPYLYHPTLQQLASNSDVLIICCALNEQTRYMANKEVMETLGKEGVIVNIARGSIANEKELVECWFDVFEEEPSVPREMLDMDDVVLLPHRAAFTEESVLECFELVVGNLKAFFSNKPPQSPVNDVYEQ
ncbi:Glyoxylate reductase (NADP(+)) [Bertholletia excelsa]